jgi:glycosyltransferase involved in cell wall biosynthesis
MSKGSSNRLWVVIPAFNEGEVIRDVLAMVLECVPNIVLVDDGSRDETATFARSMGVHVVRHPINFGQGAALQTGLEYACERGAQYIGTFDADGQHRIEDLAKMFEILSDGQYDIVLGSRFLGETINAPRSRRLLLRYATLFTNWTTGLTLTDAHNGLRAMTADTARRLDIQHNRMAHASELISRIRELKLRYVEVAVSIRYTEYSLQKGQRMQDAGRILTDLFTDWLSK